MCTILRKHTVVSTKGEVHYILEEPGFNNIKVGRVHDYSQIKKSMKNEALKPLFLNRDE
jgi:hypothetical protein